MEDYHILEERIRKAAEDYYLGSAPSMSDVEFDQLVEELRKINPLSPILAQVGWGMHIYGAKVPLPATIELSLPKIHHIKDYPNQGTVLATPKIDGMAVVLQYDDKGMLKLAALRGDGVMGIDVTPKVFNISDAPITGRPNAVIKGELYIKKSVFEKYLSKDFANPRNTVSGLINRKSLDMMEYVSFVAHDEVSVRDGYPHCDVVPATVLPATDDEINSHYKYYLASDFPIDGIVLDSKMAYKVQTEEKFGVIDHIDWNLSGRGQYVPVGVLKDPVQLYGTSVACMSLFNAQYVMDQKIGPGTEVMVTKANEIIPYITKVVNPTYPGLLTNCKSCGSELVMEGAGLYCRNIDCNMGTHILNFMYAYWTEEFVGDMVRVIDALNITSFERLAAITEDEALATMSKVPGYAQYKAIAVAKKFSKDHKLRSDWFLMAIGLKGMGETWSGRAVDHLDKLAYEDPYQFIQYLKPASNVEESIRKNWVLITKVYDLFHDRLIKIEPVKNNQEYKFTVVLTGKMSATRSEIVNRLNLKGVRVADGINKDVKYLVQADPSSNSSKSNAAKKMGIKIISESELWNIVE